MPIANIEVVNQYTTLIIIQTFIQLSSPAPSSVWMANRSFLSAAIKRITFVFGARNLCSPASASRASSALHATEEEPLFNHERRRENTKNRISRLLTPRARSPVHALQGRVEQGDRFSHYELRRIVRSLVKSKRYLHALEVLKWMENQKDFRMTPDDHAMKLELIIKNYGLTEAEEYFISIPDSAAKKAAGLPLLRGYVRDRDTSKAEGFMVKLYELGLVVSPHPYNEMMKLYLATCEYRKVPLVIQQMKRNRIPCNVLSYNLWMDACSEGKGYGVAAAETVFRLMQDDANVQVGWSSLATLANVYMKAGKSEKAIWVLKDAEKKLSTCKRLGYFFLLTLYTSLKEKEEILRLWEASKSVGGRISCANYICILTCLVKLGDIVQARRIFTEWESNCRKYDVRVSNVLLGAYMRNGLMEEAESLHHLTLERGGCPNYKTWEILIEGYVKSQKMDKAVVAMKRALTMVKNCHWRPPHGLVIAIAEYLEKHQNFEYANEQITDFCSFGIASVSLYKILLRMHLSANKPPFHILKMMEEDNVEMDSETLSILKAFNRTRYDFKTSYGASEFDG